MSGMPVAGAVRGRRVLVGRAGRAAGLLASAAVVVGAVPGVASAHTYHETGSEQTYVVPPGVHSIHVAAIGGMGAAVMPDTAGGRGAFASATLPVVPGQVLYVEVGGNAIGPTGGFNGGANGDFSCCAGGGGGASDVRSTPATAAGSLSSRLIVAGGGGGAGNGDGGGAGMPGASTTPGGDPVQFGGPGTLTGPGAGGFPCGTHATAANQGADGVFGAGGAGGFFGGGGGGGGYWGGGGGGGDAGGFGYSPPPSRCAGGGGGGSSFFSASAAHTRLRADTTGVPQVEIEADPPLIHRPHPAAQAALPL